MHPRTWMVTGVTAAVLFLGGCAAEPTRPVATRVTAANAPAGEFPHADMPPVVVKAVAPYYPLAQKNFGLSGEVIVAFVVEADGSLSDVHAVHPPGAKLTATDTMFAEAAVECVKKWKFRPAQAGGHPVRAKLRVPIQFKIDWKEGPAQRLRRDP